MSHNIEILLEKINLDFREIEQRETTRRNGYKSSAESTFRIPCYIYDNLNPNLQNPYGVLYRSRVVKPSSGHWTPFSQEMEGSQPRKSLTFVSPTPPTHFLKMG
jgi:hypothetical protein